jgi:RNA polymerase-binding transcription factor DksA
MKGALPVATDGAQRRDRIEEEIECVQAQLEAVTFRLRQDAGWRGDEADQASDLEERTNALILHQYLVQKRQQLEHTRVRLGRGFDGACEVCGLPIDPGRLKAMIGTSRCLDCQRRMELGGMRWRSAARGKCHVGGK